MNIQISAKKIEIIPEVREFIKERLGRLEKFNHKAHSAEAVIKAEERCITCELIITVDNSEPVVIEVSSDTIQAAVDQAADKAERQLRKGKERDSVRRRAKLNESRDMP